MHPALKLFCILWLFMGTMGAAVGFKNGVPQYGIIGVVLAGFSISGIIGFRAAPAALMYFWLSMLLTYIVMFATGNLEGFTRAVFPCLMFIAFAFVSFLCGEPMPTEEPSDDSAASEKQPNSGQNDTE
jgi:hypothetical protein